jgi:hypothetical protein
MYYVSESLKYFWYLLGYVDESENIEEYTMCDFVVIEKNSNECEPWKKFIENMKKDKESDDFPLHHENEKLKLKKPENKKQKIKKYENKWGNFLIEVNKKKMS